MTDHRRDRDRIGEPGGLRRRQFLRSAAVGGFGIAVAGGRTAAGFQGSQATVIELGGSVAGWEGRAPAAVVGRTNPTLRLEPDAAYVIEWENVDGRPHNVVIEDANGTRLVRSELVSERGKTQHVEFTARPEMTTYYCEAHPSSMVGTVQVDSSRETGEAPTATTEVPTETGREPTGTPGDEQTLIPPGPSVRLETIADGLVSPVGFEQAPGQSNLGYVVDQPGQVYQYDGGLREEPFLDVSDRMIDVSEGTWADYDERGLLALAFHPSFVDNRKFYVRYSAPPRSGGFEDYGHTAVVSEFTATDTGNGVRPGSERVLLEVPVPGPVHNGGPLAFGPDGYLYVGLGDGSSTTDSGRGHADDWYDANPGGNGQDVTDNLLGSILRIDVDGGDGNASYGIPDGNPLVGETGLDEHYAWGFRNPWRMSFDSSGRLFVGDPGVRRYEEVDLVEKGGNYGWNVREGTSCYNAESPDDPFEECPDSTPPDVRGGEPLIDPILEYPHWDNYGRPIGIAVIGGYFVESDAVPALEGTYVFGDFSRSFERPSGSLFAATPPGNPDEAWRMEKISVANGPNGQFGRFLLSFGRDRDGYLYTLSNRKGAASGDSGALHRIVPAGSSSPTASTR